MRLPEFGTLPLLGVIFLVFIIQGAVPGITEKLYFVPSLIISEPWRIITSIFLHAGFTHLLFNCFALFMFGPLAERKLGASEVFKIFMAAGIIGNVAYWLAYVSGITADIPGLGASGAIYGIMAAAAVLFPEALVFLWFVPMKMRQAVAVWLVLEFVGTLNMAGSGVASAAHLGGLIFGYLYTKAKAKSMMDSYYQQYYV
jgi:membrane associated rhomboid family serine protease